MIKNLIIESTYNAIYQLQNLNFKWMKSNCKTQ